MMKRNSLGYLWLSLAQASVGFNIVVNKQLITTLPLYVCLGLRFFITAIFLFILLRCYGNNRAENRLSMFQLGRREWLLIVGQALCANVLFNIFMVSGLYYTSATAAGIITSFIPAFIMLFAILLLGENVAFNKLIAIVVAVAGLIFVSLSSKNHTSSGASHPLLGDLLVFLAVIPEALYTILAKLTHFKISLILASWWINVITFLLFLPTLLWQLQHYSLTAINLNQWILLVLSAIASGIFYIAWSAGLRQVSANHSALFVAVMPITTVLLAIAFLGEHFNWYDGLGLTLVMVSIVLGAGTKWLRKGDLRK